MSNTSDHSTDWGALLRNVLLGIVLLAMLWLAFHVRLPSLAELQQLLDGWGGAAWIAFTLLYAVVAVTPIPVTIMAVTGGVLFGVVEGAILSVIGALVGSWVAYWLARALGKQTVTKLLGRHARTVEERLTHAGVESVYLLRLMPGLPYWPVNYGSGAFGISQRDFLVGSGLSTVPGQVSLVAVGAFVASPSVAMGAVVVIAWIVVITMTIFAYRRLKRASRG
ncbi:TVP38/TMEM64 family protein [Leucobacter sp. Psy1]|uniref:TVP38/TMEM64 family protein n=1 Tax=Leucobacter sp. Psy1 TaxID=2875729 RepID=UPI001CD52497|nr:TVP38/TMEM64 family protein [Leucobacter sp. Psy1]UBH05376.1 TVP38/TMEM64 family protein [Leucobacter sp. Psy1]